MFVVTLSFEVIQTLHSGGHLVLVKLQDYFLKDFKSEVKGFWISSAEQSQKEGTS